MGNSDSIPVVSQVKSLVQVVSGDEEGARKTQENFIRTGIIASQVNSLVHHIKGNDGEAKKIQEEFIAEAEQIAKSTPVIGHGIAAGYAIAGENEEAEKIAMGATKTTVATVAGVAGVVCGPGAIACGAAFATGSMAAWDGIDSAIAGENRGLVKQVDKAIKGDLDAGESFDLAFDLGGDALLGGAMSSFGAKLGKKRPKNTNLKEKGKIICKRSISEEAGFFNEALIGLPEEMALALPNSLKDIQPDQWDRGNIESFVGNIFSVFFILSLMKMGHPASKPFYDEICNNVYPKMVLRDCYEMLQMSLIKYSNYAELEKDDKETENTMFEDSLKALLFEMTQMMKQTIIGKGLNIALCNSLAIELEGKCVDALSKVEGRLNRLETLMEMLQSHSRVRRSGNPCSPIEVTKVIDEKPKTVLKGVSLDLFGERFLKKHVINDAEFYDVKTKLEALKPEKVPNPSGKTLPKLTPEEATNLFNHRRNKGQGSAYANTLMKESDAKLILAETKTGPKTTSLTTQGKYEHIITNLDKGTITVAKSKLGFEAEKGVITHMNKPRVQTAPKDVWHFKLNEVNHKWEFHHFEHIAPDASDMVQGG